MDLIAYFCADRNMPQFNMTILMLLMTVESVETQIIEVLFDMVEPGQSIVGRVGAEQPARRNIECSSM